MRKNISSKIFLGNLIRNTKTISLNKKLGDVGKTKYLPSYSKEWRNTIYSYNKNILKNTPVNTININKIIKSYFDLYFKDNKFREESLKLISMRKRRKFLRRIYVSNAEIKHTNNKAVITLYTVNQEKKSIKNKYLKINKKISMKLIKRFIYFYKNSVAEIYNILNNYKNEYTFTSTKITRKSFLKYKLEYLSKFIKLKHLYLKKIWNILISNYTYNYLSLLRKYDLTYSLNQYKFNQKLLLPKLSNILSKILGKKIEYNIINLKSIAYNTDIFTKIVALKISKKKWLPAEVSMYKVLNKAHLPVVNTIKERTIIKKNLDRFLNKYRDLKIISNLSLNSKNEFDKLLSTVHNNQESNNNKELINNIIYNSIDYKNMAGVRLEIKGRLTKRYRADRSLYSSTWKGGLKNIDSSFKRLSSVSFRGNLKSNVTYSLSTAKRRVGAFAVKGWISGK